MIGGQQANALNQSGWNKSTTREFYFDVLFLLIKAIGSRPNGHDDPIINVAEFQKCIIEAFANTATGDGSAIVWTTVPSRMNRYIGKAKTFRIGNLDQVAPIAAMAHLMPIVDHTMNRYAKYHFSAERVTELKGKKKAYAFGSTITSKRGTKNYLDILFVKLLFHLLEIHLRGGPGNTCVTFKASVALKDTSLLNGLNFTIFFWESTDQPDNYMKNLMRRIAPSVAGKNRWLSVNWLKLGFSDRAFSNIDRNNWDIMINSNGNDNRITSVDVIAPLLSVGPNADDQSGHVRGNNWNAAMNLYIDSGVVTREFVDRLMHIRALWHQTHLMYTYQEGDRPLEALVRELTPFVPGKTEDDDLTKYLFD
jgi:hypothetical protein